MSLRELFTSDNNVNYIITNTIQLLVDKGYPVIDKNDISFYEKFNIVASSVFKYESKRLSDTNIKDSVNILNNIVIQELSKFIINKQPIQIQDKKQINIPEKKTIDNPVVLKIEENTFRIIIDSEIKEFVPAIENISVLKLKNLYMYNENYIINDKNNLLSFKEKMSIDKELYSDTYNIIIEPGNYTPGLLIETLEDEMCILSGNVYKIHIHPVSNKLIITKTTKNLKSFKTLKALKKDIKDPEHTFDIIYNDSSILKVLGFINNNTTGNNYYISDIPVKLIKKNKLNFNVTVNINEGENIIFNEPIILNSEPSNYNLNIVKQFNNIININKIILDFGDFNHQGYPFYLLIEITQKNKL